MRSKTIAAIGVLFLGVALAGCSGSGEAPIGGDVVAPVTMGVNELQGASVELVVGQVLNIDTESLSVDSYSGEVADRSVAEFSAGHAADGAVYNPGVTALATGKTTVTMTNEQGGIQPLTFTVVVAPRSE